MKTLIKMLFLLPVAFHRVLGRLPFQPKIRPADACFANISEGTYAHGVKSFLPDAATTQRYLIYKQGSDADHCAMTGAGDKALGSSDDQADAGIPIAVKLFGAHKGTVRVITDGSIANGDFVKTGAAGVAVKAAAVTDAGYFGKASFGTDTTAAAGDTITVETVLPVV